MNKLHLRLLLAVHLLFSVNYLWAQSPLTIDQIMEGEDFIGHQPHRFQWSEDSKTLYFYWNPEQKSYEELYKVAAGKNTAEKVGVEEQKSLPAARGDYNQRYTQKVYAKQGDIYLYDIRKGKETQITNTVERERNPKFLLNENHIVFQKGNNLFIWKQEDGSIQQVTNFKKGSKAGDPSQTKQQEWLEEDQLAHFEILKQRKADKESREAYQEQFEVKRPLEIYLEGKSLYNTTLSPDGKFVTYTLRKYAKAKSTELIDYVTESGYATLQTARPKVGSKQDTFETAVYDIEKDTTYTVDTKQIEGIFEKPTFLKEYVKEGEKFEEKYEKPREVIIHPAVYSADGKYAAVDIRAMDNKDRWIMLLDLPTGKLSLIDRQHDDAWIGGPNISGWNLWVGEIGWIGNKLWYHSEETGFSHLYTYDVVSKNKKALTAGEFEIINTQVSRDQKYFYLTSNKESSAEHHFYKLPVAGGTMQKITQMEGGNEVTLSPDEKQLAIRHAFSNQPWELYLKSNKTTAKATRITKSTTEAFDSYQWRAPEVITFDAQDGAKVHARLYKPANPKPNGKAVIFVHGAGYLQNVHKWWSVYYREYMFHNFLADQGYTVLDIDYRGSEGYGRDWRTGIYRHMGGKDLSDQVDGAKYLVEAHNIDPNRIGIYGGSYGGFMTLMAMFTEPDVFRSGAALRSVTDWAHYNHPYTSNILNTPEEDPKAYRRSSPLYFADGLKKDLVILHGMMDDNVQFQDVVRLSQRLIELRKENWEMAVFPMEPHGFKEATSWADEYKRIFKLFEKTL
ncbi:S9 family peptidase [Algivirga pacifica]|uniref:Prolyl oligopeptidase family serine peptidase n=1 Tax=Algivirga pacifica TaxID=1162670 RepID=A0ABP9DGC0_9BACT